MELPEPRGALSSDLISALRDDATMLTPPEPDDDEDLHLSLWTLYELHYRGFDEVDDAREWDPDLLALRARLEEQFEADLRAACGEIVELAAEQETVPDQLVAITAYDTGVSLPHFLQRKASIDQYLEFLMQRSLYHLKESDPHAWVLPRLDGRRQGSARRAAVRRVRRRSARAAAQPAVRRGSPSVRTGPVVRRVRRPGAGLHARRQQRDVSLRSAPPAEGCGDGPPGGLRDDQLASVPSLSAGRRAPRARRSRRALLRRARRGRRRARAPRVALDLRRSRGCRAGPSSRRPSRCRRVRPPGCSRGRADDRRLDHGRSALLPERGREVA